MKVFAIAAKGAAWTQERFEKEIAHEAQQTLKLYLDGKVEQFWLREKVGPIFLMNVQSLDDARATLSALPFVSDGLMTYEFVPIVPLAPLGRLIQRN